jgi:hypothetical protein
VPLDPSSLTQAFVAIFAAPQPTPAVAAQKMAQAYFSYASAGTFGPNLPVLAGRDSALQSTLLGAIAAPAAGSPATFGAAWNTGLLAFWAAVPVTGAQVGVTAPPTAPCTPAVTAAVSNPVLPAAAVAAALATALHTCTLTVLATVAPPPSTVIPIT